MIDRVFCCFKSAFSPHHVITHRRTLIDRQQDERRIGPRCSLFEKPGAEQLAEMASFYLSFTVVRSSLVTSYKKLADSNVLRQAGLSNRGGR
jgi:hypothetical protein